MSIYNKTETLTVYLGIPSVFKIHFKNKFLIVTSSTLLAGDLEEIGWWMNTYLGCINRSGDLNKKKSESCQKAKIKISSLWDKVVNLTLW